MFEAILPVSNRETVRRHFDRLDLLLASLDLFWSDIHPLRLHIVIPDNEYADGEAFLKSLNLSDKLILSLVSESQLHPEIGAISADRGYAKQMLIKLAAYRIVNAPFCLILDTDVVCCKAFGLQSFVTGSRTASEWAASTYSEWWFESARVLGMELRAEQLKRPLLGVTPQILSTSLLRKLTKKLDALDNRGWIQGLMERYTGKHPHVWTEYALYDLYATSTNTLYQFHLKPDEIQDQQQLHCHEQNIWSIEDYQTWNPGLALQPESKGHFMVLQSIICRDVDFDDLRKKWQDALVQSLPRPYIGSADQHFGAENNNVRKDKAMEFSTTETRFGKFLLPAGDLISESIKRGGGWDTDLLRFMEVCAASDKSAIDAGANVGFFSVQMSKHFKQVWAFEPQRLIYYSLCANILMNGCYNVFAENLALYNEPTKMVVARPSFQDGPVPLTGGAIDYERFNNFGGVAFEASSLEGNVSAITIDSLNIDNLGFIKSDCQGVDFCVLQGAFRTIARCRPVIIFESEQIIEEERGITRSLYDDFFSSLGYRNLIVRGDKNAKQVDYLAFPEESKERFQQFFNLD